MDNQQIRLPYDSGIAFINYNFLIRPHLKNQTHFSYFYYDKHPSVCKRGMFTDLNNNAKEFIPSKTNG